MSEYFCRIFQLFHFEHQGRYVLHFFEGRGEKLAGSYYADKLDELLLALLKERKKNKIREITTIPAVCYSEEIDWKEVPIPDKAMSAFIEKYRSLSGIAKKEKKLK